MRPGTYGRLVLRESRRSRARIALFVGCIAVGVAAVVLVAGLSAGVNDTVRTEGRRLMAADLVVEGRRPMPGELDALLANYAALRGDGGSGGGGVEGAGGAGGRVERADVTEFVSVVLAPDTRASQLAELKVVKGGYPFYGTLKLDPPRPLGELLAADAVVAAPELLNKLGAKVGGELRVGGAAFRVAGAVLEEPDKLGVSFTLGPRLFMSPNGLARTALLDRGARVEYRALLKLPAGASGGEAERLKRRIEGELPGADFLRVRTFSEAQPALRRSFDRMGRYLGLVGLLSLLIGGVGVAQVSRAWLASRMDDIAILRCIGARPREVVWLYLAQVAALALAASLTGAALGTALHALLPRLSGGLLPADLIRPWQPAAIMRGVLLGLATALVFTLPLIVGLRRVPPVRVLRRDAEPVRPGWLAQGLGVVLVIGGVWAASTVQSDSLRHGTVFTGGLVATVLLLAAAAAGVSRLARLLPRDAGGLRLRHGLAHLARPGAATVGAVVALGVGVTFVFATRVVERHLSEQLQAELPADAPSTFFVDVQPGQWAELGALLKREGASGVDSQPIVTARFAAIDGVPVNDPGERAAEAAGGGPTSTGPGDGGGGSAGERTRPGGGGRQRGRRVTRELRITYGGELPRGNRVIAGAFPSGRAGGVSVEENFARDLGVGVGSTVTLDVQGVPVDLTVTSLRTVDWRTFGINFFLFAEPGPLDAAPQTRVAVARLAPDALTRVQSGVVDRFPNVTVIHVRDVMDKVLAVLGNLGVAVKALGAFTVVAGVVVLGGTVAATQARRAREVALLKAIGMTRRDVVGVFAVEYALTGAVAATVGVAAGALLAWAVLTQLMQLQWSPHASEVAAAAALTVGLSVLAGLLASARALAARPVEVLRSE